MCNDKQINKQCQLCKKIYIYKKGKIAKESRKSAINYVHSHADSFLKKLRLNKLNELSKKEQQIVFTLAQMGKETLKEYLCKKCCQSLIDELMNNTEKIEHLKIRNFHLKKENVYLALQNYNSSFREFLINQELIDIGYTSQIDPYCQFEDVQELKNYLKKFHDQLEELENLKNDLNIIEDKIPELEDLAKDWINCENEKDNIFLHPKLKSDINTWDANGDSLMDYCIYALWSVAKDKDFQVALNSNKSSRLSLVIFEPN